MQYEKKFNQIKIVDILSPTPALFYMDPNTAGFNNKGLPELSSYGIIWRLLALLMVINPDLPCHGQ
jgi:hypothetical protein